MVEGKSTSGRSPVTVKDMAPLIESIIGGVEDESMAILLLRILNTLDHDRFKRGIKESPLAIQWLNELAGKNDEFLERWNRVGIQKIYDDAIRMGRGQ